LALFNLASDSKLRGCDLVELNVSDVAPNSCALDRATVRQKKTGQPVKFEITELKRESINLHIHANNCKLATSCSLFDAFTRYARQRTSMLV